MKLWLKRLGKKLVREADVVLFDVTVYDYNRHGIVAFQAEDVDKEQFKAWADERKRLTVAIFVHRDDL